MSGRRKVDRPFQCQECGKRLTVKQAEATAFGPNGCPKCGGSDIDEAATDAKPERS